MSSIEALEELEDSSHSSNEVRLVDDTDTDDIDALALLARSKARVTNITSTNSHTLDDWNSTCNSPSNNNSNNNNNNNNNGGSTDSKATEADNNHTINININTHTESVAIMNPIHIHTNTNTTDEEVEVEVPKPVLSLAEEAAALLQASRARLSLSDDTPNRNHAAQLTSSAKLVAGQIFHGSSIDDDNDVSTQHHDITIVPLRDDEVLEESDEDVDDDDDDDMEDENGMGVDNGYDVSDTTIGNAVGSVAGSGGVGAGAGDLNEEDVEDARAYATAMLTVANVSDQIHEKSGTVTMTSQIQNDVSSIGLPSMIATSTVPVSDHNNNSSSSSTRGGTNVNGADATYDKRYIAKLAHLPPALINALLHEEAMLAAEKAAMRGQDSHVFNLTDCDISDLAAEVRRRKDHGYNDPNNLAHTKGAPVSSVSSVFTGMKKWVQTQRDILQRTRLEQEKAQQRQVLLRAVTTSTLSTVASTAGDEAQSSSSLSSSISIANEPSNSPAFILTYDLITALHYTALPLPLQHRQWSRVYSLARDGDSFDTFLHKVNVSSSSLVSSGGSHNNKYSLIVVRTTKNDIFGGFVDDVWRSTSSAVGGKMNTGTSSARSGSVGCASSSSSSSDMFYGGGQALLFKAVPKKKNSHNNVNSNNSNNDNNNEYELHLYKWTGQNRYVQLCDANLKRIAMGGGGADGSFGLCVQDDFRRGSTGKCSTFDNEPLCQDVNESSFEVLDFEVWCFLRYI